MLYRSALYVPAAHTRALEKARTAPCDLVIFDLEDATAPADKPAARQMLRDLWASGFHRPALVRINGAGTPWHTDDLALVRDIACHGVVVPKVRAVADLPDLPLPLWPMIETPQAVLTVAGLAADPAVAGLILGLNDLGLETGISERAAFMPVVVHTVIAARAHGRVVLDGVCNVLDDPARVQAEAQQAQQWGCDGKTLIHPDHIAPTHAAFTPDAAACARAERLIAAYAAGDGGAVRFEGQMIEALHVRAAEQLLACAQGTGI